MTLRIGTLVLPAVVLVVAGCAIAKGSGGDGGSGKVRMYYIAADQVTWDYAPGGRDQIVDQPFVDTAFFVKSPPKAVATSYKKTLYREYTDSTFTMLKPRPPEWAHLGFLGPLIRGVVGDTIKILFKNNGQHPFGMHPHGVFYNKDSEGAPYSDGTSGADKSDDGVPPGGSHLYVWPVPERAGPGPMEGSSVMWMYHSHIDEVSDVNSGLLGPMLITARGKAKEDGSPNDVDRELVVAFAQVHEENNWAVGENLGPLLAQGPAPSHLETQNIYPWFVKFTMNGFVHGTLPLEALTVKRGQRVRWYLFASTNDFDAHAPHWHGNTVLIHGMRTDVTSLTPMEMVTADMVPDNPGTWLFHCHISFHLTQGMQARYKVE
jgi:FtsP/CotA-like multicopper oxidase with cupredoxin domain